MTWAQQADMATYSASVDDSDVQSCFFDCQDTSLSPRNCNPPEVLLRVDEAKSVPILRGHLSLKS